MASSSEGGRRTLRCGGKRWCRQWVFLDTCMWPNNRLSAVTISSSISSDVWHRPRLWALRKRALILDLSSLDDCPAKDGSAYVITDWTIARITQTLGWHLSWFYQILHQITRQSRRWSRQPIVGADSAVSSRLLSRLAAVSSCARRFLRHFCVKISGRHLQHLL